MAEGPLASVQELGDALPTPSESNAGVEKKQQPPLRLKVLSWNIFGSPVQGMADRRNRLVPGVVETINPDVLLLQETKTQLLLRSITEAGNRRNRQYTQVPAGDPKESQILYDSKIYDNITNEKIFPVANAPHQNLREALDTSIRIVFPPENERELRGGVRERMRELFANRLSYVGLKRTDDESVPENVIILMSFHNVHTRQGINVRDRAANGLCQIVRRLQEQTGAVVLAGADMNKNIAPGGVVLNYDPTVRRAGNVIDYILLASPPNRVLENPITALDFMEAENDNSNPLHDLVRDLLRPDDDNVIDTIEQYGRALDHDPLQCELTITMPPN